MVGCFDLMDIYVKPVAGHSLVIGLSLSIRPIFAFCIECKLEVSFQTPACGNISPEYVEDNALSLESDFTLSE